MNMSRDNDGVVRLQVVRPDAAATPSSRFRVAKPEPARPQRTPAAEAAARYRARKRGEEVTKRKPGPAPKKATERQQEVRDLKARVGELENLLRIAESRLARRTSTLTMDQLVPELLAVLRRSGPELDNPERRVLLRDLVAEIESRQEEWPDR